jgi:outer membrane protein assembly factor BamA
MKLFVVALLLAASTAAADELDGRPIVALSVTGLIHIKEAVVVEQIESRPGRTYLKSTADDDLVRLERLRVFSDISITPIETEDGVRIEVRVVETLRILPALSVGVSDESGVSIGPAIKVLSVAGHPQEVSAAVRFGGEGLVEMSEVSPFLSGRRLWHSAKLSIRDRQNGLDHFTEHSLDLDSRIGMRGSDSWKTGLIVQAFTMESHEDGITLEPDNTDQFLGLGVVAEHDTRDSWTTTSRGWWNSVDAIWHSGSGDYGTFDVDVRRYQPVAARQTLVATALLTLQSGQRDKDVPTYVDYALGGANSVRGWDFASRRGKNQFIASVEHRYMVLPTRALRVGGLNLYGGVGLAVFGDVGSAWNDADAFSDNVIGGAGIGLRLFVPFVDVIRLDLSFGNGRHTVVGIGEKAVAQRNRVR